VDAEFGLPIVDAEKEPERHKEIEQVKKMVR